MTITISDNNNFYKYERLFYFFSWIGAVLYSVYNVLLINDFYDNYHDLYNDFAPGWTWIGRKQDVSDQEWRIWIPMIFKLLPWIFVHHFISHIIKRTSNTALLCCWYILVSGSFLHFYIGMLGMLCIFVQPIMLYILTYKCERSTVWLINTVFLFVIHFLKIPGGTFQNTFKFNDEEHYILTLTMCWIQLRSISFSIDNIEKHLNNKCSSTDHFLIDILWKLTYCLYLPTLSLGPLILYSEFRDSMRIPFQEWKLSRLGVFALHIVRYIFWMIFADFSLHFFYFNAMQYHPEVVQYLNSWTLYGLGYCMGQFFLIKYVVVYGLNNIICAIDNVKAPPQPKCVARVHLYSDMWKYFDQGLYKFLIRYIYAPLLKSNVMKIVASFLCFTFVYVWHGMQTHIFIWALLNFVGLNIESLMTSIGNIESYSDSEREYVSSTNRRRFYCAIASPLLAMSVISNFYFFGGEEIGHIYIYRILHDPWYTTLTLHFFLYCCCHVSTDIKKWELRKQERL